MWERRGGAVGFAGGEGNVISKLSEQKKSPDALGLKTA
jgi:hypothetical protein